MRLIEVIAFIGKSRKRNMRTVLKLVQCSLESNCSRELLWIRTYMLRKDTLKLFGTQTGCISKQGNISLSGIYQLDGCLYSFQIVFCKTAKAFQEELLNQKNT